MFVVVCLCVSLLSVQAQENPNTITFDNRSGEPALVKLIGPTSHVVEVPKGQSRTVNVAAGKYYILVRYGSKPGEYTYRKGEPFTVQETETHYSTTTIILKKEKVGGGAEQKEDQSQKEEPVEYVGEERESVNVTWIIQLAKVVAMESIVKEIPITKDQSIREGTLITVALPLDDSGGKEGCVYVTPQSPFVITNEDTVVFWKGWINEYIKETNASLNVPKKGYVELEFTYGKMAVRMSNAEISFLSLMSLPEDRSIKFIDDVNGNTTVQVTLLFDIPKEKIKDVGVIMWAKGIRNEVREKGLDPDLLSLVSGGEQIRQTLNEALNSGKVSLTLEGLSQGKLLRLVVTNLTKSEISLILPKGNIDFGVGYGEEKGSVTLSVDKKILIDLKTKEPFEITLPQVSRLRFKKGMMMFRRTPEGLERKYENADFEIP